MAEDLHHALGVSVSFGSAVGCKGKLSHFVRDTLQRRGVGLSEAVGESGDEGYRPAVRMGKYYTSDS